MTERELREKIELSKQTEARLWEKLKARKSQRERWEKELKEKERVRLEQEKANFPVTKVPEKASGKEDQKRKAREALFEECMARVKEYKRQKEVEGQEVR